MRLRLHWSHISAVTEDILLQPVLVSSALEVYTIMRYTNPHYTYLVTYLFCVWRWKVIIASIMCGYNRQDWTELARMAEVGRIIASRIIGESADFVFGPQCRN